MKPFRLFTILLLALLLGGCESQQPPGESVDEGVFTVQGIVDNQAMNLAAGMNDFYMSTGYTSDSLGIYSFTGELKQNCANCKQSLKISIRNYTQSASYNADQALYAGNYNYNGEGPVSYRVTFKGESKGSGAVTHLWDFGDGTTSSVANPVKDFKANGNYLITYNASFDGGCGSSLSYTFSALPAIAAYNNLSFGYSYVGNRNVRLFADNGPGTIAWYDNNFYLANTNTLTAVLDTGIHKITLRRIIGNDTIEVCRNIPSENYLLCNATYSRHAAPVFDLLRYSAVTIEYTDATGHVYTSMKALQRSQQYFRITSSSDYLLNESGQQTRKLGVEFDCLLSDGVKTISLKDMHGTFAVARP